MDNTFRGKLAGKVLEAFLRALPPRSLGHLPPSRGLGLHPSCHSIPPPVRSLRFRHRRSRLRTHLASMGGITLGILLLLQLPSLGVHIQTHGRPQVPPYQSLGVHLGYDKPSLRQFAPIISTTTLQSCPLFSFCGWGRTPNDPHARLPPLVTVSQRDTLRNTPTDSIRMRAEDFFYFPPSLVSALLIRIGFLPSDIIGHFHLGSCFIVTSVFLTTRSSYVPHSGRVVNSIGN